MTKPNSVARAVCYHRGPAGKPFATDHKGKVPVSTTKLRPAIFLTVLGCLVAAIGPPAVAAERHVLEPRPGAKQTFLLLRPHGPPKASVVLYAGGSGSIGISDDGALKRGENFLVRTRAMFAAQGFLVLVPDRPSDWAGGDKWSYRLTKEHARDAAAFLAFLRAEADIPVWLVGTSRGSISAANAAARIDKNGPEGIVLTASVTNGGNKLRPSLADIDLDRITAATLILGHRDDDCYVTPWSEQADLAGKLTKARTVEAIGVSGGQAGDLSAPCGSHSHHGFLGIEKETVAHIAAWILSNAR